MKLTIDPKVLAEVVAWAARTIPQRPALPVLSGLLLIAEGDHLAVCAFDYDVSVRATVAADVAEPGRVVLPGRILAEVVKSLPGESWAELVLDGQEVVLTCGRAVFNLLTLPESDFPTLPEPPAPVGTVDGAVFRTAVEQVAVAASKDDTLPWLTSVRFDSEGEQLTMAATDRYRIAVRDFPWTLAGMPPEGVNVPATVVSDLVKGGFNGTVSVGWDASRIGFVCDGRSTVARLLDNQFIDYRAQIGYTDRPITATVSRAPLVAAVKRVCLLAEREASVRLRFASDGVLVQASTGDLGRGAETVPCELVGTDLREIAFNPGFLLDAIGGVQQEHVLLHMDSTSLRALIRGQDSDSYQCVVQALRLP